MTPGDDPALSAGGRDRSGSDLRNVIAMVIPVVMTTSSRALMDVADFVMITQLHSDAAQAAILPAQMIMWVYIVFGMGVVSLVNTFASQCLGRQQYRDCSAYAWQTIYMSVVAGLVILPARPFLSNVFAAIGHDPAVQVLELAYADVTLLSVGPTIAAAGLGWFFVGIHRPWTAMWSWPIPTAPRTKRMRSSRSASRVKIAPPTVLLCPSIYLVVE